MLNLAIQFIVENLIWEFLILSYLIIAGIFKLYAWRFPLHRHTLAYQLFGIIIITITTTYWCIAVFPNLIAVAICSTLAPVVYLVYICHKLYRLGISGIMKSTEEGINYDHALKLARKSFVFLGIGAHKLTSSTEFKAAMVRCATGGRKARFLLSPPGNPAISLAEQRNTLKEGTYASRIEDSLRAIARLRKDKNLDIEVRRYTVNSEADHQDWRMMFVDDALILSWTVWDSREGKNNPQLILSSSGRMDVTTTMHQVFIDHYDKLWNASASGLVDLAKYE